MYLYLFSLVDRRKDCDRGVGSRDQTVLIRWRQRRKCSAEKRQVRILFGDRHDVGVALR